MRSLVILLVGLLMFAYTNAMQPPEAEEMFKDWVKQLHNHPWDINTDPCDWLGVKCDSAGRFLSLDLSGKTPATRLFTLTGDLPNLKAWEDSGNFPEFKFMHLRGARLGPRVPEWLMEYWQVGWDTPLTENDRWKFWIQYWDRKTDEFGNYVYYCDPCGPGQTGLGCRFHPGCVSAFVCPLPWNLTTEESTAKGLFCTNLNLVRRTPTHGPTTGGTNVQIVMNIPAQYNNMSCSFDGIIVPATGFRTLAGVVFKLIDYFYEQRMLMQFNCTSPPHEPGTVEVHLHVNGERISDHPVLFDYECPPGTEEPEHEHDDCVPCKPGYFARRGEMCKQCPIGTYNPDYGAAECLSCPPGTVSTTPGATTDEVCEPCPTGTYWENSQCKPCQEGYFSDKPGRLECLACPLGTTSNADKTKCEPCPAGQYGVQDPVTKGSVCIDCPPGTFSPSPGLKQCLNCPLGYSQPNYGQTKCDYKCPPGTYSPSSNYTQPWEEEGLDVDVDPPIPGTCVDCPPGYYSNTTGSLICKPCPYGYYSTEKGSTECLKCPTGQKTETKGATYCVEIPRVVTQQETTGTAIAIVLAVVAVIIAVATVSYIIYKKKQHAITRRQIEQLQESAALS